MSGGRDAPPSPEMLVAAVEAVLFAAGEPVEPKELAKAMGDVGEREVLDAVEELGRQLEKGGRGLVLEKVAGGYRLATRSEVGAWVRGFFRQRHRTRLSPASLETLAIIAYRQPITLPEIQAIRGVDPSGPLKSLLEKKMIRLLGRKKVVGTPWLYGTTKQFLVHFGLDSLEDLPSIDEFEQIVGILEEDRPAMPVGAEPSAGTEAGGDGEAG